MPSQERKVKFHIVPLFQNSNSYGFGFGISLVVNSFSPRGSYFPLICLFCVLRTQLSFLAAWDTQVNSTCVYRQFNSQGGDLKEWVDRKLGFTPFVVRVLPTVAKSQGKCPSSSFFCLS